MIEGRRKSEADIVAIGVQECHTRTRAGSDHSLPSTDKSDVVLPPLAASVPVSSVMSNSVPSSPLHVESQDSLKTYEKMSQTKETTPKKKIITAFKGMVKENAKTMLTDNSLGKEFLKSLTGAISPDEYTLIDNAELMEMRLFVFVRKEHVTRVHDVSVTTRGTGVGGLLGNKGGVAIQLTFQFHRIIFISCHRSAYGVYEREEQAGRGDI